MNNSDMPAMPQTVKINEVVKRQKGVFGGDYEDVVYKGLTKREHFAGLVMQGILSSEAVGDTFEGFASVSVKLADALLAELDKDKS